MPLPPDQALTAFRAAAPHLYTLGNLAALESIANILLAAGATPMLSEAPEEVTVLVANAAAVTLSLGAPAPAGAKAVQNAAKTAQEFGHLWLLDASGVSGIPYRQTFAATLLRGKQPAAIRGNAEEILTLAGQPDIPAAQAAQKLAKKYNTVVIASGATSFVTDGKQSVQINNGHPLMSRVAALDYALSALIGGFIAAAGQGEALPAAAAAVSFYGLAGERAATGTQSPGSFAVAFLDALAELHPSALVRDARIIQT